MTPQTTAATATRDGARKRTARLRPKEINCSDIFIEEAKRACERLARGRIHRLFHATVCVALRQGATWTITPSRRGSKRRGAPYQHAIDEQYDDGSDDRHDEPGALVLRVESHRPPEESAEERTDDAEQHGHYDAAGVPSGHHQLGDHADDETENYPAKNSEHRSPPAYTRSMHGRLHHRTHRDAGCTLVHARMSWPLSCFDGHSSTLRRRD